MWFGPGSSSLDRLPRVLISVSYRNLDPFNLAPVTCHSYINIMPELQKNGIVRLEDTPDDYKKM
jgi:hypothetical protein